jgi:hypothetical protein
MHADCAPRAPCDGASAAQLTVVREQQNEFIRQRIGRLYRKACTGLGNVDHQACSQNRPISANHPGALTHRSANALTVILTHRSSSSNFDRSATQPHRNNHRSISISTCNCALYNQIKRKTAASGANSRPCRNPLLADPRHAPAACPINRRCRR